MSVLDQKLVQSYLSGDRHAGEAIVDRYYSRVLAFFNNKIPSVAADLAQQTFLACFEGLARLANPSSLRSFVFAIAHNQLRKHFRDNARYRAHFDFSMVSAMDLDPSPSRVAAEREEQQFLLDALRRIPLDYQVVLELFYWEDMSASELAATLELPLGTAKTRIRRGRQILAEKIAELHAGTRLGKASPDQLDAWARSLGDKANTADTGASDPS